MRIDFLEIAAVSYLAIFAVSPWLTLTNPSFFWPTAGTNDVWRARTDVDGNFVASGNFIVAA